MELIHHDPSKRMLATAAEDAILQELQSSCLLFLLARWQNQNNPPRRVVTTKFGLDVRHLPFAQKCCQELLLEVTVYRSVCLF